MFALLIALAALAIYVTPTISTVVAAGVAIFAMHSAGAINSSNRRNDLELGALVALIASWLAFSQLVLASSLGLVAAWALYTRAKAVVTATSVTAMAAAVALLRFYPLEVQWVNDLVPDLHHRSLLARDLILAVITYYAAPRPRAYYLLGLHALSLCLAWYNIAPSCVWLAVAWDAFQAERNREDAFRELTQLANLVSAGNRRFLSLVGNRPRARSFHAPIFVINHAADEQNLTASLEQVRAEEVERSIFDILGPDLLHHDTRPYQFSGVVDPETTTRPCLAALRMFCSLYLDVGPLVERRLERLQSLIPIVNPELAHSVSIRRRYHTTWHFSLDYHWVDQFAAPEAKRGLLSTRLRLQNFPRSGSAIWLTRRARQRMAIEAPILVPLMQPVPTPQELYYTITFESLIPRLQKYFGLEGVRQHFNDYASRPEIEHLAASIQSRLRESTTQAQLARLIREVLDIEWAGYREKDRALDLLLDIRDSAQKIEPSPQFSKLLFDAVNSIGYPTQRLYQSLVEKYSMRERVVLEQIALDPTHERFIDCWLYLAGADQLAAPDRDALIAAIGRQPERWLAKGGEFAANKVLDFLATAAQAGGHQNRDFAPAWTEITRLISKHFPKSDVAIRATELTATMQQPQPNQAKSA